MAKENEAVARDFNEAFKVALQREGSKLKDKAGDDDDLQTAQAFVDLDDIAGALGSFCKTYAKIDAFLDKVLGPLSWFSPKPVAMVKAFLDAFEKTILPIVCPASTGGGGASGAGAAEPAVKKNYNN
jgi:hypothetical protein